MSDLEASNGSAASFKASRMIILCFKFPALTVKIKHLHAGRSTLPNDEK